MEEQLSYSCGCLLGLAIGDAMGCAVDKKSWEQISEDYGPNGLLGYDMQSDYAEISSYTQLAAFVCNGLLLNATRGQGDAHLKYITYALRDWAKSQQFLSITEKTHCWMAQVPSMRRRSCMDTRMVDTLLKETLGTPEEPVNTYEGPAGITAALPIGLFFDPTKMDAHEIGELSVQTIAMLHGAPDAFLAGAVLAYAMAGIIQEPEVPIKQQFAQALDAVRGQFGKQYPEGMQIVDTLMHKAFSLAADGEITPLVAMTLLQCTTAAECLAGAAYACMIHHGNFDEALIVAVNHTGRSAAVGAITGAIMGARMGKEAIPEFYLESLEVEDVLNELNEDMGKRRQLTRLFDDDWDHKYVQGVPVS